MGSQKSMYRALLLILTGMALADAVPPEARVPNDPFFCEQLGFGPPGPRRALKTSVSTDRVEVTLTPAVALDLPRAWTVTTGSRSVIVGLLDDGFFYMHEDVAPNVWRNPGETGLDVRGSPKETNGVDDDADGYVDDAVGWDFAFDDPDPDPYVFDGMDTKRIQPYCHSIGALGIIGAKGNNHLGIAGINWDVSLMLLKIGCQGLRRGEPDMMRASRAARAIRFAADHGARVVNWSGWMDDPRPEATAELRAAVRYAAAHEVFFVLGAGNEALDLDRDENCRVPQCLDEPNLLNVAELDSNRSLYRYALEGRTFGSNFGMRRVEISAFGSFGTG